MKYLFTSAVFLTLASQANAFSFCSMHHDVSGQSGILYQIEAIPECDYGKGAIWRINYRKLTNDPTHLAALYCDFSKQILMSEKLHNEGYGVVTCVVRNKGLNSR